MKHFLFLCHLEDNLHATISSKLLMLFGFCCCCRAFPDAIRADSTLITSRPAKCSVIDGSRDWGLDYASAKCPSIESSLGVINSSRRKPDFVVFALLLLLLPLCGLRTIIFYGSAGRLHNTMLNGSSWNIIKYIFTFCQQKRIGRLNIKRLSVILYVIINKLND